MRHKCKTAEARRKPVLIDRFHLAHPQPCQTIPAF
ncbi:putative replication RepA4 domain protein, partial [Escherichia coli P0298942.7]